MHAEILDEKQKKLLPLVKLFKKEFYLVGGTAVALQIGHRKSIDFDLFKNGEFNAFKLGKTIKEKGYVINKELVARDEEYTMVVEDVKWTFFNYPFDIGANVEFDDWIKMPSLLQLAAMKAYTLGRRNSWKDYVDLYFILKTHLSLAKITKEAQKIFKGEFNAKLFREQLSYFNDIRDESLIDFLIPNPPTEKEIKDFLVETAIQ